MGETISSFVDVGEQYEFQIVSDSRDDGQVTVSIKKIMYAKAWQKLSEQYADDPVFEAEIFQVNRGGAIVLVEGLRAFLPGSHIMGTGGASEAMVGKRIPLKFLEVNEAANKLVVSNRRAVIEHSMASIKRGDVYDGIITAVKPYGAFVEIMGMSGVLHISQISYDRVENLEATLAAGMAIKSLVTCSATLSAYLPSQMKPLQNTTPALRLKSWLASRLLKRWSSALATR